jgi:CheY-like chemotaxis protein
MECTRLLRSQQSPVRTRPFIIAQTANVTEEYRRSCLDSGMDWFLSKPIAIEELSQALKRAFTALQQKATGIDAGTTAQPSVSAAPTHTPVRA